MNATTLGIHEVQGSRSRPRARLSALAILLTAAILAACGGHSKGGGPTGVTPPAPDSLTYHLITNQLDDPVFLTAPAGDVARLFVIERVGRIRVIKNDVLLAAPFLDLTALVRSTGSEQGLLGLAFDPQFSSNGYFYVDYIGTDGNTRIARYHAASGSDVADPVAQRMLLTIPQPEERHNGGMLAFGRDGYLYIGSGDGDATCPCGRGQSRNDLLGCLLRIDVSGSGGYTIPAGNPFSRPDSAQIWCYGLRNPWRFSFDRQNGDLYIGDVGESRLEEVDVATAASGGGKGLNFGWQIFEGTRCAETTAECSQPGFTSPALEYSHSGACCVIGGYVYRGSAMPGLVGTYFYGDLCGAWVNSFRFVSGHATEVQRWSGLGTNGSIYSFGEDARGELYVLTSQGEVLRIVAATGLLP